MMDENSQYYNSFTSQVYLLNSSTDPTLRNFSQFVSAQVHLIVFCLLSLSTVCTDRNLRKRASLSQHFQPNVTNTSNSRSVK